MIQESGSDVCLLPVAGSRSLSSSNLRAARVLTTPRRDIANPNEIALPVLLAFRSLDESDQLVNPATNRSRPSTSLTRGSHGDDPDADDERSSLSAPPRSTVFVVGRVTHLAACCCDRGCSSNRVIERPVAGFASESSSLFLHVVTVIGCSRR